MSEGPNDLPTTTLPTPPWNCSCGGEDEFEPVDCIGCETRHHIACAFTLLRGNDNTAKWAALRDGSFLCWDCKPPLYSWKFRCSCMRASAPGSLTALPAVIIDYDDNLDQNQCEQCWCWAHPGCDNFVRTNTVTTTTVVGDKSSLDAATITKDLCPFCAGTLTEEEDCAGTFRFVGGECDGVEGNAVKSDDHAPTAIMLLDSDSRFTRLSLPQKSGLESTAVESSTTVQLVKNLERINGLYWRRGMRDDKIYDEVVMRGVYERPVFDLEILPGDVWLDIGAHIGVFTSLALIAGASVVAVEPDPENFDLLERNAALNTSSDACAQPTLIRAAVVASVLESSSSPSSSSSSSSLASSSSLSLASSETTLYRHPDIGFRHSTINKQRQKEWTEITVPATTLPALLQQHPDITAIKIDCQGSEVAAIKSVSDDGWGSVRKMSFEYDFEYAPDLETFHEFIDALRRVFPYIYHSKQPRSGKFRGFPNGVLVYAKRDQPRVADITDRYASGRISSACLTTIRRSSSNPKAPRKKKSASVPKDTSYWDRFKKAPEVPSSSYSTVSASSSSAQVTSDCRGGGGGRRPKRQCAGLGIELDHTKALDAAGYVRTFRYARGSSNHRQTKFVPADELSDIEDEMDMGDVIPEEELNRDTLTGLPSKKKTAKKKKKKGNAT